VGRQGATAAMPAGWSWLPPPEVEVFFWYANSRVDL
jgi:hypothetical protein